MVVQVRPAAVTTANVAVQAATAAGAAGAAGVAGAAGIAGPAVDGVPTFRLDRSGGFGPRRCEAGGTAVLPALVEGGQIVASGLSSVSGPCSPRFMRGSLDPSGFGCGGPFVAPFSRPDLLETNCAGGRFCVATAACKVARRTAEAALSAAVRWTLVMPGLPMASAVAGP